MLRQRAVVGAVVVTDEAAGDAQEAGHFELPSLQSKIPCCEGADTPSACPSSRSNDHVAAREVPSVYDRAMVEAVYTSLLVLSALVIGWFSVFVVYKLFKGQR